LMRRKDSISSSKEGKLIRLKKERTVNKRGGKEGTPLVAALLEGGGKEAVRAGTKRGTATIIRTS